MEDNRIFVFFLWRSVGSRVSAIFHKEVVLEDIETDSISIADWRETVFQNFTLLFTFQAIGFP